ncbi:retrovirus-related pol polyprotein from transposon TNT 1-94 [Tanacetum coccineum]
MRIQVSMDENTYWLLLTITLDLLRTDNDREFVNQPPRAYYEDVWISHQTSVARSPQQNDVAKAVATSCYTQNRSLIRKRHNKTLYELLHNRKPDLYYLHVFGALCYPTNDSEDLGKLKPKADIGIFVGYAPAKKAYRIYNKRTRLIIETIHVDFDELTAIASKQFSSGPEPQLLNPGTISSGLVPNPPSPTPYVPPTKKEWDTLFQPMFDKYFNPPPSVVSSVPADATPRPADPTGTPSSTTIDQDEPSLSTSQTPKETQSLEIPPGVEEHFYDIEVAHLDNNPFFGVPIPELNSEEYSSRDVIPTNVHSVNQPPEHLRKWTKDHPLDNVIRSPSRLVSTRHQLQTKPCFATLMLSLLSLNQRIIKNLLRNPFSKGTVDPALFTQKEGKDILLISQSPRGIFLNQSKYALEIIKKYGMETSDPVDTPMVEKSKLDEDPQRKVVDPTRYRGMIGSLMYLTSSRPELVFSICMCARYQAKPTEKHLHTVKRIFRYLRGTINMGLWYSKDSCIALTAFADADHASCQDTKRSTSDSM